MNFQARPSAPLVSALGKKKRGESGPSTISKGFSAAVTRHDQLQAKRLADWDTLQEARSRNNGFSSAYDSVFHKPEGEDDEQEQQRRTKVTRKGKGACRPRDGWPAAVCALPIEYATCCAVAGCVYTHACRVRSTDTLEEGGCADGCVGGLPKRLVSGARGRASRVELACLPRMAHHREGRMRPRVCISTDTCRTAAA